MTALFALCDLNLMRHDSTILDANVNRNYLDGFQTQKGLCAQFFKSHFYPFHSLYPHSLSPFSLFFLSLSPSCLSIQNWHVSCLFTTPAHLILKFASSLQQKRFFPAGKYHFINSITVWTSWISIRNVRGEELRRTNIQLGWDSSPHSSVWWSLALVLKLSSAQIFLLRSDHSRWYSGRATAL